MVVVSYSGKEINAKLVYYGAGLSGKTTNLESIYEAVPETSRGKMVSMKTQSDRTLFFDLLPLDLGEIMGFKTRFLLYTVPGQVFYNATRKLVLKGADAVVFVADSEVGKMDENRESLANLRANLAEYGVRLEEIPWVLQYNKRDLETKFSVEELNAALNPGGTVPWFEAVANHGRGVFETFRGVSHLLMEKVTRDLRRAPMGSAGARPARGAESSVPHDNPLSLSTAPIATHGVESGVAGNDAFEFGREVSLPQEAETRTPPPPAGQRAVRRPEVPAPAAPIRTAVPAVAPAPVPAPFAPAAAAAPVTHAAPATGSPSSPLSVLPSRISTLNNPSISG